MSNNNVIHIQLEDSPLPRMVTKSRDVVFISSLVLGVCGIISYLCLLEWSPPTEKWITAEGVGCQHPIYCTGEILRSIQLAQIFNDSKTFVDMPIKTSVPDVELAYAALTNKSDPVELAKLVENNFLKAGWELEVVNATDWVPNPRFLSNITDQKLKTFARSVHNIWNHLIRRFNTGLLCPDCYSSMSLPNNFVVPGGRFREFYYWDTYWILEGLYVSGMYDTAKGIIHNLISLITRHGFIPNGARLYYLNRSQPPLFAKMLERYIANTDDKSILKDGVKAVQREYYWWIRHRSVSVFSVKTGRTYVVNNYNVTNINGPRPESYIEDVNTSRGLPEKEKMKLFSSIASAAESGWDFSSRWLSDPTAKTISSINTSAVIPVDLNSILYQNEMLLYTWLQNTSYLEAANKRKAAIFDLFWSPEKSFFVDFNVTSMRQSQSLFPSGAWPLWAGIELSQGDMMKFVGTVKSMVFKGGIPTSVTHTGQQWDFPNAWSPLQHVMMLVIKSASKSVSESLANSWLASNYCGWSQTGYMYEKYNVTHPGVPGSGGEYTVQEGFGWTNGVALWILNNYGLNMTAPDSCIKFKHKL